MNSTKFGQEQFRRDLLSRSFFLRHNLKNQNAVTSNPDTLQRVGTSAWQTNFMYSELSLKACSKMFPGLTTLLLDVICISALTFDAQKTRKTATKQKHNCIFLVSSLKRFWQINKALS